MPDYKKYLRTLDAQLQPLVASAKSIRSLPMDQRAESFHRVLKARSEVGRSQGLQDPVLTELGEALTWLPRGDVRDKAFEALSDLSQAHQTTPHLFEAAMHIDGQQKDRYFEQAGLKLLPIAEKQRGPYKAMLELFPHLSPQTIENNAMLLLEGRPNSTELRSLANTAVRRAMHRMSAALEGSCEALINVPPAKRMKIEHSGPQM